TLLIACVEALPADMALVKFIAGAMIGIQGSVIGRHLCNLATFLYVRRHPDAIGGTVTLQHELVLWLSVFQHGPLLFVVAIVALYVPEPGVLGAFAGIVMIACIHLIWIERLRRVAKRRAAPPWPQAGADDAPASGAALPSSSTASGTNLP